MGKNVAVFVDVANIFYAAKAAGVDIDYVTLLKSVTAGRDFVRAYAYTGLDPDNENQRNFHQFLARHQYKVVSKDIRKYGDGKVKANLDIELVVDLMKTARNLDVAVIVSGDGDFASAIRAVQEMGVRVEVVSFRGNTSSDLIEVADLFTEITQIAKVDKGSTRSGRRVADDDEDLSMTEVPDKMTEGTGRGRGRGRGRSDREGGYSSGSRGGRSRRAVTGAGTPVVAPAVTPSGAGSRGGRRPSAVPSRRARGAARREALPRGRRRRPGRGSSRPRGARGARGGPRRRRGRCRRGRGRGRGAVAGAGAAVVVVAAVAVAMASPSRVPSPSRAPSHVAGRRGRRRSSSPARSAEGEELEGEEVAAEVAPRPERAPRGGRSRTPSGELPTPFDDLDALAAAPRGPKSAPFGSVWDRQLGTPAARPAAGLAPLPEDDEDLEEPAIPEYLLAEQRRGQGGRGGGGGGARRRSQRRQPERLRRGDRARALRWWPRHEPEPLLRAGPGGGSGGQAQAAVVGGSSPRAVRGRSARIASTVRRARAARNGARCRRSSSRCSARRCIGPARPRTAHRRRLARPRSSRRLPSRSPRPPSPARPGSPRPPRPRPRSSRPTPRSSRRLPSRSPRPPSPARPGSPRPPRPRPRSSRPRPRSSRRPRAVAAAPKPRATRKPAAAKAPAPAVEAQAPVVETAPGPVAAAPKPRATRKPAAAKATGPGRRAGSGRGPGRRGPQAPDHPEARRVRRGLTAVEPSPLTWTAS